MVLMVNVFNSENKKRKKKLSFFFNILGGGECRKQDWKYWGGLTVELITHLLLQQCKFYYYQRVLKTLLCKFGRLGS